MDGERTRSWVIFLVTIVVLVGALATIVTYLKGAAPAESERVTELLARVEKLESSQQSLGDSVGTLKNDAKAHAKQLREHARHGVPTLPEIDTSAFARSADLAGLDARVAKLEGPRVPSGAMRDLTNRVDGLATRVTKVEKVRTPAVQVTASQFRALGQRVAKLEAQPTPPATNALDALPVGTILAWLPPSSATKPPSGWRVCNGRNSSLNLTGRFLMGASSSTRAGRTGGGEKPPASSNRHWHHHRSGDPRDPAPGTPGWIRVAPATSLTRGSFYWFGPYEHEHKHEADTRPPYLAVTFIEKYR